MDTWRSWLPSQPSASFPSVKADVSEEYSAGYLGYSVFTTKAQTKVKSLSPKQREKRKAEARKRDKTKREAWMLTPSDTLVMKFKRLPEN